jgi:hypothetical protein
MAKFTYYALALVGTDFFLPEPSRGKDFAITQPTSFTFPRLFKNKGVAGLAKAVWEQSNQKALEIVPMTLEKANG